MANQLGFHVDLSKCTGCKACQVACKDKNDLPMDVIWRRVAQYTGGEWIKSGNQYVPSNIFSYFVSVSCMHCDNPLCLEVCPAAAISKNEDGIVEIDQDKCVGCRYCEWTCPYGAPQFNADKGTMTKCNFCVDLLANGEKPACVAGCTFRALDFGPIEELREKYGHFDGPAPLVDPSVTKPNMVFTPRKTVTMTFDSKAGEIANPEEL
ncbi:MAG TPA: dimethylsulfoxide reductase subunit B [Aggregatilinea sp.]|uniref:DMSO/selenate family reductase complex B subunit n=1 Tax=Aggregatilinea sp. TaxID=2806333 RepID=UPI002CC44221|nr:DMSO/selenate family reductase complex B subunit [Aggregatilinea sp.]HML24301.1 dimethylsulfoxide reductase subunit B [Aggregatilinea sp.]